MEATFPLHLVGGELCYYKDIESKEGVGPFSQTQKENNVSVCDCDDTFELTNGS